MSNFIISLDFELKWGMLESGNNYDNNLLGARKAIPLILKTFNKYKFKSTWAIVGLLFNSNYEDFLKYKPSRIVKDKDIINPYSINLNQNKNLFFALDLVELISKNTLQEIGTHTYSHFTCRKGTAVINEFREDIKVAQKIAKEKLNIKMSSIVFPRNEICEEYFKVLKELEFTHYRGNPKNILYKNGHSKNNILIRILRYADTFFNIVNNTNKKSDDTYIKNVQANRMLRPYMRIKLLNFLMIRRIKNEMLYAAKNKMDYHLWWHPHNFGVNTNENIQNLENILKYYDYLKKIYGMGNCNISEV